jgi:hypothetical protein
LATAPPINPVGDEWLLLEVGATLRDGVRRFKLTREAISLETSDGTKVPLPTVEEYRPGRSAGARNRGQRGQGLDQLFPADGVAGVPDRLLRRDRQPGDGVEPGGAGSDARLLGRLYFKVPGGIKYGSTGSTSNSPTASCACRSGS